MDVSFGSNVDAASFQSVNASIWKTNAIKLFQKPVFSYFLSSLQTLGKICNSSLNFHFCTQTCRSMWRL